MSNGIRLRQNEEHSIEMLAAQRQLYSNAKRYDWLSTALSVWIPFGMAIILVFIPEDSLAGIVSYIVSITSAVISFIVDGIINNKKELAAAIQQKFDTYIYNMPWDTRIFGKNRNLNNEIAVYSSKILSDEEEKKFLYDWYTPLVDEKELKEGILSCQRENVWWDVGLRKRFKMGSIMAIIILCIAVFIMGICKNESTVKLLWRFAFVAPMLEWLFSTIKQLNKDINELQELDEIINDDESKSMEDLQDIQKLIFIHRKDCFAIPNFFYKHFKDNDEDKAHRAASMH